MIWADAERIYTMQTGPCWKRLLRCYRTPGLHALACHRFGMWLYHQSLLLRLVLEPVYALWFWHVRTHWGIEIGRGAQVGPGCYIGHFGGIVVSGRAIIGARVNLSQGVTIGDYRGCPVIGNDVYIAPGAKLFGKITIGDNVKIGANCVVHHDIEANAVVAAPGFIVLSHRGNVRD